MKKAFTVDVSDADALAKFSALSVDFREPKKTSSDSFLCPALYGPDVLQLRIPNAKIVRVIAGKGSATILLKVSSRVVKMLMEFDERCLSAALNNTDSWFMHKMNPALIEDFFKGSTEVNTKGQGIVARFKLACAEGDILPNLNVDAAYDIALRLSGLQFRKQNFCALWKLTQAKASAVQQPQDDKKKQDRACMILDVDEDDDSAASSSDGESDVELLQPSHEDIDQMINDLGTEMERLDAHHNALIKHHKDCIGQLKLLRQKLSKVRSSAKPAERLADVNAIADAFSVFCSSTGSV